MRKYLWNIIVSLDQLVNVLWLGDPDETVSSRAAKASARGDRWACVLCKVLDRIQKDHCKNSVESDEGANAVKSH